MLAVGDLEIVVGVRALIDGIGRGSRSDGHDRRRAIRAYGFHAHHMFFVFFRIFTRATHGGDEGL